MWQVLAGAMNLILIRYSVKFFRKFGSAPYAIICSITAADSLQTLVASPMLLYLRGLNVRPAPPPSPISALSRDPDGGRCTRRTASTAGWC